MCDNSMQSVEVEAYYLNLHEKEQAGEYQEKSLMDWEQIYTTPEQRAWLGKIIASSCLSCQFCTRSFLARLYKIFVMRAEARRGRQGCNVQEFRVTVTAALGC